MLFKDNILVKSHVFYYILFQNLEANKMAALAVKMQKIEDASKKKDEQTSQFISQTKEALDQKMEIHVEKREAYISDLKTKMKVDNVFFRGPKVSRPK